MNTINLNEIPEWVDLNEKLQGLPESCNYYRKALLADLARQNPSVLERIAQLKEQYGPCWVSARVENGCVQFEASAAFDTREEMLAFVEKHSITLPKEVTKSGRIRDEKPMTVLIYTFEHDGIAFSLSYSREGFPTKHCKVVVNTSFDIACDIGGDDTPE